MQLIKRIEPKLFLIIKDKSAIHLNFQPFITTLGLTGNYVLMHWNKLIRQYGYYDVVNDRYFVHSADKTVVNVMGVNKEIDLKDGTLPTACVVYPNSKLLFNNDILTIEPV